MTTKARGVIARIPGQAALVEDFTIDDPGPNEVLVKVLSSGVCHTDLGVKLGTYGTDGFPFLLGHEGHGIVEQVGAGVTNVKKRRQRHHGMACPLRQMPLLFEWATQFLLQQPQRRKAHARQKRRHPQPGARHRHLLHPHLGACGAMCAGVSQFAIPPNVAHRLRRDDRRGRGLVCGRSETRQQRGGVRLRRRG